MTDLRSALAEILSTASRMRTNCEILAAIELYRAARQMSSQTTDQCTYLECQRRLLRLYAEAEDKANAEKIVQEMETLADSGALRMSAGALHALGICASYQNNFVFALENFKRGLDLALGEREYENICLNRLGIAHVYRHTNKLDLALAELEELKGLLPAGSMDDLRVAALMTEASVRVAQARYAEALSIYGQCFESLRYQQNLFLHISLLYSLASAYRKMKKPEFALEYARLADRLADPKNLAYLSRFIRKLILEIESGPTLGYDLVLNVKESRLTERSKGEIELNNQHVISSMLEIFMREPGRVFSKEEIVQRIWNQAYDPAVHDNKIYVTIRRLRRLIEGNDHRPEYIRNSKNGYFLAESARVNLQ